ncbi:MAG: phosphoribosylformylglycinamidine synthase subunit PurS, partial [Planctomycetota bacterium]|nr:phosphoribosylformylglycinamidine synthase subunit PurS [Planctomycetota bacterium]
MIHRVEIRPKDGFGDPIGDGVHHQIRDLALGGPDGVRAVKLFFLIGPLDDAQAGRVGRELLIDPIYEAFALGSSPDDGQTVIEVHRKPGVMDPVAASTEKAIADMGVPIEQVRTAWRYEIKGDLTGAQRETIARGLLANPVIEDVHYQAHTPPEVHGHRYEFRLLDVPIRELDDAALVKLAKDGELFLNLQEMKAIQDYYRRIGREPRDVELEMLAQTWSEHCGHKTLRSDVCVKDLAGRVVEEIPNLLKNTIFGSTNELNKPWCISVFRDNAGVVEFDDTHAVCFKVETHNHPSAIEPYGGAATGIGGVVRDPMGTGLGAAPIANTDVFCFGLPDMPLADVPKGVLHPRRVMRGVVSGVRDYGNRMGIPTLNGAVYFDEKYLGNPLVFCGTVGLMPRDKCFGAARESDAVLVVGGRTGRDGIHGATFSSGELTHQHETEFSHAVQIGNAITEKKTLDTILQARDEGLFSGITDCGAGGLSSAVGEMGQALGAEVHLERVPLKYAGLSYDEIWISEAQERMVLAVPQGNLPRILEIFAGEDVEATVIGHFGTPGRMLRLFYAGELVGEMEMDFLHEGLPRPTKEAVYQKIDRPSPTPPIRTNYNDTLLKILAAPNVASKEWIIRQYDHEVQGGSVIKSLVGVGQAGPGDAAVIRPVLASQKGVVISCGMNPRLGELDPYQSALHAVDEALRNGIAVGGKLFDTMIAHSLLEPEMRHGMDYLSEVYLGYTPIPITRLIGDLKGKQINMADVSVAQVAEYAAEDADVTWQLRAALEPLLKEKGQERVFYEVESPLVPVLVDMEFEGIRVDAAALAEFAGQLAKEMDQSEQTIYRLAGTTFNLNSPRQLGQVLFDLLKIGDAPKKTKTGQYSTDEQTLATLAPKHEIVQRLLEYRTASKLKSTYADALPEAIWPKTGRVHTTYNQVMTSTGRL